MDGTAETGRRSNGCGSNGDLSVKILIIVTYPSIIIIDNLSIVVTTGYGRFSPISEIARARAGVCLFSRVPSGNTRSQRRL